MLTTRNTFFSSFIMYLFFIASIAGCSAKESELIAEPYYSNTPTISHSKTPTPDDGDLWDRKFARAHFPGYIFMLPEHLIGVDDNYIGATFPLYCGYLTLDINGVPIFVKKTSYSTYKIDNFFKNIEKHSGYINVKDSHGMPTGRYGDYANKYGYISPEFSQYYHVIHEQITRFKMVGIKLVLPDIDSDLYLEHPELMIDDNYAPQFTKTCTLTGTNAEADQACLKMRFPGRFEDYIKEDHQPKLLQHAVKQENESQNTR